MPLHRPQANKNEGGKVGKHGPPWDIIVVYNVTRKKRSCQGEQPTPSSHFPVLLDKPSIAQDGWCIQGSILFPFLMAPWISWEKWAAEPMASCYSDCISNKLSSVRVYFKHGDLAGCGVWLLVSGTVLAMSQFVQAVPIQGLGVGFYQGLFPVHSLDAAAGFYARWPHCRRLVPGLCHLLR